MQRDGARRCDSRRVVVADAHGCIGAAVVAALVEAGRAPVLPAFLSLIATHWPMIRKPQRW